AMPAPVRPLLRRCLEKDPKKRLRDIGDAMALVESAASPADSTKTAKRSRWPVFVAVSVIAVGLVIAAVASWLLLRQPETAAPVSRFLVDAPPGNTFSYTYTATAISPDSRFIVFRAAKGTETPILWLRPLDSLAARPIPGSEGGDFPFWSPDSK